MNKIIADGIKNEKEAISYYTFLLCLSFNGNERRSIEHILKEEKEHLVFLEKLSKKY